jgi:hypothetical protein
MDKYIESDKVAAPVLRSVRPLEPLHKRIRNINYIFKLRVSGCDARSFSSVGMEATALFATQGFR